MVLEYRPVGGLPNDPFQPGSVMKLLDSFDAFMCDVVNLNQARIDTLEGRIGTIADFVRQNYEAGVRRAVPQGSWAHKTIIKPATANHQFDADLVLMVSVVPGWHARDYVDKLHEVFSRSDRYRAMTGINTRCVTLTYAGDFHLDVVPSLIARVGDVEGQWVCNRATSRFERTAPEEYSMWLADKNTATGDNKLRKVIRLMKFIRDARGAFAIKSILLATLLGEMVWGVPNADPEAFADLPSGLKTLVDRLDDWLRAQRNMPVIRNPVLPTETFMRHWDQAKFAHFSDAIHTLRGHIDDAFNDPGQDTSAQKWRGIFGEEFAPGIGIPNPRQLSGQRLLHEALAKGADYVAAAYGLLSPPHAQRPRWTQSAHQIDVRIRATTHTTKNGVLLDQLTSGGLVISKSYIKFEAYCPNGLPDNFVVHWQVTNIGDQAVEPRGDFYSSKPPNVRWEYAKYPGVHWVKAYVVSSRTGEYVGRSNPFLVTVSAT